MQRSVAHLQATANHSVQSQPPYEISFRIDVSASSNHIQSSYISPSYIADFLTPCQQTRARGSSDAGILTFKLKKPTEGELFSESGTLCPDT